MTSKPADGTRAASGASPKGAGIVSSCLSGKYLHSKCRGRDFWLTFLPNHFLASTNCGENEQFAQVFALCKQRSFFSAHINPLIVESLLDLSLPLFIMLPQCLHCVVARKAVQITPGICYVKTTSSVRSNGTNIELDGCSNVFRKDCPILDMETIERRNCKEDHQCTRLHKMFRCEDGLCYNITSALACSYKVSLFSTDTLIWIENTNDPFPNSCLTRVRSLAAARSATASSWTASSTAIAVAADELASGLVSAAASTFPPRTRTLSSSREIQY